MSTTQEETYPLLLLFLDDETTRGRRVQIEKGRHHGITSGASSVITEWPSKQTKTKLSIHTVILIIFRQFGTVLGIKFTMWTIYISIYITSIECRNEPSKI